MKKSFFLAFLIMLFSLTLFGCKKENPTVDIVLESTHDTISYDLAFKNIKSDADRKYKIVLYTEGTKVVEDVNLLTEVSGEFKNLTYNTVYSVSVLISKKAKSTDFNIEIGNKSISTTLNEFKNISFENLNTVYDGKPKSIYVEGAPEGTNIEYTGNGVTDAGTHEVTAKLSKEGFKELTLKANIVIAKGTHSLKLSDVTKVYDGKPISVNLDTDLPITYEYYSGNTKLESAPSDVGEYTVKAIFAGDKNYEAFELSAKYIIKNADADIELKNKTVVYNGEAQELVADTTLDVTYEYYLNNEKLTSKPVNVGVYTVKAVFAGDKNHAAKTVEATLTITKADTSISVVSKDIQLDYGKTLDLNAEVSNGATPTIKYNTTDGKAPVNVGKYTATISYAGDNNYNAALDVVVNITIVQADIDFKFNSGTFTYDGEEKSLSIDTSLPITYEYYLGETKLTSLPVNAGVYKVKAIYAGDANHEAKTLEATLTINKASATIIPSVAVIDVVYGQDYEVTAELDNGVNVTPIYNTTDGKAPVNAGNYTATFKFEDPNYLPVDEVVVPITIRKVEVTIEVEEVEVTYDGKPHGVVPVLSNGATPSITYDTNDGETPVNAGTYFATIVYAGDENHKPCEAVGIVSILKADVTITVEPKEVKVTYDGKPHGVTATASNGANLIISYDSVDGNEPVNAGEYIATVICPDNQNYNTPDAIFIDIIIEKATYDMSGIMFEDKTVKYDGLSHIIEISGELPLGVQVSYEKNNQRNVGKYEAIAHFVGDGINYNLIPDKKATLTIEKGDVVITAKDLTVTYDGQVHTVPVTVSNNLQVNSSYKHLETGSYSEWMNGTAGTYEVEYWYPASDEYNYAKIVVTMIILKATPIITVQNENIVVEYNEDYNIVASVSNGDNPTITYSSGEKPTEPGVYTAVISYPGNVNYLPAKDVTVNINIKRPGYSQVEVEVNDITVTYGEDYTVTGQIVAENGTIASFEEVGVKITYDGSETKPSDAGEYKITVTSPQNDELLIDSAFGTATLVIKKAKIDMSGIVFEDAEFTYEKNVTRRIEISGDVPEYIACNYVFKDSSGEIMGTEPVNAGTYTVVAEFIITDADKMNNYEVPADIEATLIINQATTKYIIQSKDLVINYNESLPVLALVENDDNENISIKYYKEDGTEIQTDPTAVGKYYAVIKYNGNNNYKELAEERINITINALDADFSIVGDLTKVYDGQPLTVSIDKNLEVEYKYYQTDDAYENKVALPEGTYPINAGKYIVQVIFEGNDVFNATSIEQRLLIDYASTTITVKFNDEVVTDGESIEITYKEIYTITAEVANGNNQYVDIVYTTHENNKPYFCGEYNIHVNYVEDPNYGEIRFRFNLIITPADLDIIMETEQTVIYNGLEHEIEASLNVDDTQIILIEYYINEEWRSDVLPVDAGTYKFRVTAGGTATNYNELVKEGTLIITPGEFNTVVKLYDKTVTYDGNNQTLEISGQLEEGLSVSYEYYLGEEKLNTLPVNVGIYTVKAILVSNSPNHKDKVLTATLTIEKAEITDDMYETSLTVDLVENMTVESIRSDLESLYLSANDYTISLAEGENQITVTLSLPNYIDKEFVLTIIVENEKTITVEDLGTQFKGRNLFLENLVITYKDNIENRVLKSTEYSAVIKDGQDTNGVFTIVVTYNGEEYEIENAVTPIDIPALMIYAAYGGNSNSGAKYSEDFIIIYNDSNKVIDLSGYSVQTSSSTATSGTVYELSGSINPYSFYEVVGKTASDKVENSVPFLNTEKQFKFDLSGSTFKIILSMTNSKIEFDKYSSSYGIDFIGVGPNASHFEGEAPVSSPSGSTYIVRKSLNDSNENSKDFVVQDLVGNNDFDYLTKEGWVANQKLEFELSKINFEFIASDFILPVNVLGNTVSWTVTGDVANLSIDENGNVDVTLDENGEIKSVNITYTMIVGETTYTNTYDCQITKSLAKPVLSLDMYTISWNKVLNAGSYDIYVNGIKLENPTIAENDNVYSLNFADYLIENGYNDLNIYIIAIPIDDILESSISDSIKIDFITNDNELVEDTNYILNITILYTNSTNTYGKDENGNYYSISNMSDISLGKTYTVFGSYETDSYDCTNLLNVISYFENDNIAVIDVETIRGDLTGVEKGSYGNIYKVDNLTIDSIGSSNSNYLNLSCTNGDYDLNLYLHTKYITSSDLALAKSLVEYYTFKEVKGIYDNYKGTPQIIVTEFILSDYSKLLLDKSDIDTSITITDTLELIQIGKQGSNITWSILEGTGIVIENNQVSSVTRPTVGQEPAIVKLQAELTLGNEDSETVEVVVTISPEVGENEVPSGPITYTFSEFTAGTQYEDNEEHILDKNVSVYTTQCHFTSELRIYSSSTHDGFVIIKSAYNISEIGFNAGYKVDTLNIYGSVDGETWELIEGVSITSTSYKDYSVSSEFSDKGFTYLKLDVDGTQQVRLKSMTLTFTE